MLPRAWTSLGPLGRAGGVLLSIGLIVALAALLLKWAPEWLVSGGLKGKDRAEDVGRLRTAILATLAGVLASIGAYYTHRTLKLNRENLEHNRETAARSHALDQVRQITERFTRAIDQLGDRDRLDVRLGGIYALERIARDSVDHHPQVVEVLTAFVREHAPWRLIRSEAVPTAPVCAETGDESMESVHTPKSTADVSHAESNTAATARRGNQQSSDAQAERIEPPTDSQAAMSVLGRRDVSQDRAGAQLNLRRTDLRGLVLEAGPGHWHEAHLATSPG